jgi:hypothetical protein
MAQAQGSQSQEIERVAVARRYECRYTIEFHVETFIFIDDGAFGFDRCGPQHH